MSAEASAFAKGSARKKRRSPCISSTRPSPRRRKPRGSALSEKKGRPRQRAVDRIAACLILEASVRVQAENEPITGPLEVADKRSDAGRTCHLQVTLPPLPRCPYAISISSPLPIGNLEDITRRAVRVAFPESRSSCRRPAGLQDSSFQPRHRHGAGTVSRFQQGTGDARLIARLKAGRGYGAVTDAGTPGIADPAYNLVARPLTKGSRVADPRTGCLHRRALASGLPTDRFVFENFLPNKSAARRRVLDRSSGSAAP